MELIAWKEEEFFEVWDAKSKQDKAKCMEAYKKTLGANDAQCLDIMFGYNGKTRDTNRGLKLWGKLDFEK